jgi:hypothetical protein
VSENISSYQLNGIAKLLGFKNSLIPDGNDQGLSFKAALLKTPGNYTRSQAKSFIDTFCEHLLADTDYDKLQQSAIGADAGNVIEQMTLESILKTLTFIIWTDRSIEGYFFAKVRDNTVFNLLTRLEALFNSIKH